MSFNDRVVIITGAAGRLARVLTAAFAERHARLVLLDRDVDSLDSAWGSDVERLAIATDLLNAAQCEAAITAAVERFARVDVLCHLAGGFRMGEAVHQTTDGTWDFLMDLNARTLINITRAVVPQMVEQGGGKIVSIGAHAALKGVAKMGAYCASKSSVIRLTEAMSAELKEQNINVNCVLPTIIDTPENRAAMPKVDPGLWVSPGALADVILFLASDEARAVHGAALPVTGLS